MDELRFVILKRLWNFLKTYMEKMKILKNKFLRFTANFTSAGKLVVQLILFHPKFPGSAKSLMQIEFKSEKLIKTESSINFKLNFFGKIMIIIVVEAKERL